MRQHVVALRLRPPPRLSASLSIRRFSTGCIAHAMRFRQIDIFDRFSSKCRRGHFPEDGAVGHSEAPRLPELIGPGNLCNTRGSRVGPSQRRARQVQSSQQKITGGTDAQEFAAAHSQRSFRHADRRAKRGHVQLPSNMRGQRFLEPNHDIGVVPPRFRIAVSIIGRQAIDQRVKQLLLECSRDFRIRN